MDGQGQPALMYIVPFTLGKVLSFMGLLFDWLFIATKDM